MTTVAEIDDLVTNARNSGCNDLTLLKCTSSYPATLLEGSNLMTIPHIKELFHCRVGLSDRTLGIGSTVWLLLVAIIALDGTVIEKHFTLSRAEGGVDSVFSFELDEMKWHCWCVNVTQHGMVRPYKL